jgi:hypothetical protein
MTEFHKWYHEKQVERTLKALKKNNFDAQFVPTTSAALEEVFKMIPDGAKIGVGGSVTLNQVGFFDEAKKRSVTVMNPPTPGMSPDEAIRLRREALLCDVFLSSSNAVTEDGKLYNIDGTGNRVAAMMFGPKKVILICGVNKLVKDIDQAHKKVKEWVAPMNVKRLALKTPCAETGECADCSSPQRVCNIYVTLAKKPTRTDITVMLVGEPLGL